MAFRNHRNVFFHRCRDQKSYMKVLAGPRPLPRSPWGGHFWPLPALGVAGTPWGAPWLVDASLQPLLLSPRPASSPVCLSLCLHMASLSAYRCPSCQDGGHSGRLLWCNGTTLHACNATRDAICAAERNPVPGNANTDSSISVPVWVVVVVAIFIIVGVFVSIYYFRRQCTQLLQRVASFLKGKSSKPGSRSWSSSLPNEILPPMDTERLPPAIGVNMPLLDKGSSSAPGARTPPPTFEDPEDGTELQVLVAGGSDAAPAPAPAPALQAEAPAACGLQPRAEASAPLSGLQQEYEHKYHLKDTSCHGTNRIYYEFGRKVPERKWKMLMRFVGLEDKDIEICEHENAGNLVEQHHAMLMRWRNKLGREASVFKLMAALHTMGLHVCLQNIVNKLVAENVLGRNAETSG